tara:strand:+ start:20150 stop:21499 length:1350 start_codon:yes stop_codon:yes gene_type:complete
MENRKYKIAVVGSGVYGSYLINKLREDETCQITLFEIGSKEPQKDFKFNLNSTNLNEEYSGAKNGRFFGFGGTSTKWGGKILFFDKKSFSNVTSFLSEIVDINIKYSKNVISKLNLNKYVSISSDYVFKEFRIEEGHWLFPFRKNFFKIFKINDQISIKESCKVVSAKNISGLVNLKYIEKEKLKNEDFDFVFLCAGAFESSRILVQSKLEKPVLSFADHIGLKFAESKENLKILNIDFCYKISNFALKTLRLSSELNNKSFYVHPIYDFDNGSLGLVKKIMKNELSFSFVKDFLLNFHKEILWLLRCVLKSKILPPSQKWSLNITMENIDDKNLIHFYDLDKLGFSKMKINYRVSNSTKNDMRKAIDKIKILLSEKKLKYLENEDLNNYEDVYHPFGILKFKDLNDFKYKYGKIICFSTAILPRSGSINPTGAILPLIEYIADEKIWR